METKTNYAIKIGGSDIGFTSEDRAVKYAASLGCTIAGPYVVFRDRSAPYALEDAAPGEIVGRFVARAA